MLTILYKYVQHFIIINTTDTNHFTVHTIYYAFGIEAGLKIFRF